MSQWHQLRALEKADPEWDNLNRMAEALAKHQPTAELPSLDHLSFSAFNEVYEPAADTFLLIDALEYEFQQGCFESLSNPSIALEIGCGSGVPSVFFRRIWNAKSPIRLISVATDVNPKALTVTRQTALANGVADCFELLQCDLASPLISRLAGSIDVLVFNPPYVPTLDEEVGGSGIEASWAGGVDGRRVVDRFITQVAQLLRRPNGLAYLITVDDNRPKELARRFQNLGLEMKPLFRRKAFNELLSVQKLTWKTASN